MKSVRTVRVVDLVVHQIRDGILRGEFPPDKALPSERILAPQLGVSRLTLRAATFRLQAEGLVDPRHGNGVMVLDWRRSGTIALLPDLVRFEPRLVEGFLELRRLLKTEVIALAAERATTEQRARLRSLIKAQHAEKDRKALRVRDFEIVRLLIEATTNVALLLLFNSIELVYLAQPEIADALQVEVELVLVNYAAISAFLDGKHVAPTRSGIRSALAAQDEEAMKRIVRYFRKQKKPSP